MKNRYFIGGGFLAILLYMLPYIILGENAYVTIHDFLDQNVVIMNTLKECGLLTSINGVVPNMDGLDRSLFPFFTPFDVKMVCYWLFPTYWAIVIYTFIYKIIAFLGMYLLLDTYVFQRKNKGVSFLLSLGFAFVPFYMELALSGAGFPLMMWAFLNLYNSQHKAWSYVAIVFYTFNSLLAYGGFFLLAVLFCFMVYDFCCTKKIAKNVLYGALLMGVVYILANWGTLYSLFFSESFVSHRSEWIHYTSLKADMVEFCKIILFSHYHAGCILAFPVLLLYLFVWIKFRKRYTILNKVIFLYLIIVAGILIGMLLKLSHLQIFVSIQFDRFYFFYPSVIIMLLATICYVLIQENRLKWAIVLAVFGLFSGAVFDKEMRNNAKLLVNKEISEPTFRQFYDTELFSKVRSSLQVSPDYKTKTVSVGIFPAVAEYNGFYTLDSYRVNYPLEYKREFRKIIAKELDKSNELKDYYDNWGSRCCVFSSELGKKYMLGKDSGVSIQHLEVNTSQLRKMGCQYVFSAVPVCNYEELGWKYEKEFTTDKSFWKIYLYRI